MSVEIEGKLRVKVILEDLGKVVGEVAYPAVVGNQMQGGLLLASPAAAAENAGLQCTNDTPVSPSRASTGKMELLRLEWEELRRLAETDWRESKRSEELALRARILRDAKEELSDKFKSLKLAQEQAAGIEIRLKTAIDATERQATVLARSEQEVNSRLLQQTAELQLLQRRVREEAKGKVDTEVRRGNLLEKQLENTRLSYERLERRVKEMEKDFQDYRQNCKSTPEAILREEVVKLRAQLADVHLKIETERNVRNKADVEREQFKLQMQRLALALKREREKSSLVARQELEQLRYHHKHA